MKAERDLERSLFGFIYTVQNMVTEGSLTDEKLEMNEVIVLGVG